jgi:hypothetical protein
MQQIGSYPLSYTLDVDYEKNTVVAAEGETVIALEVSNPTTPGLIDSKPLPSRATRIAMKNGFVYASCQDIGKVVIFKLGGEPPVADAGEDQMVEQESHAGTEVTLDGSGSTDEDSTPGTNDDIVSFDWYEDATLLGSGETLDYTFQLGEHAVTLVVTDSDGETDEDEVIIVVEDTTPPTINDVSANPDKLWPPNHRMVEVAVEVDAEDICDAEPYCYIQEVTSNEPVNGHGDGNTEPDWEYTDDPLVVLLRAERSGCGDGRIYTIYVVCEDASGNTTYADVEVIVPHDKGKGKDRDKDRDRDRGRGKGKDKGKGKNKDKEKGKK